MNTRAYQMGQAIVAIAGLLICLIRERRARILANLALTAIAALVLGPIADKAMRERWLQEAWAVRDALARR